MTNTRAAYFGLTLFATLSILAGIMETYDVWRILVMPATAGFALFMALRGES